MKKRYTNTWVGRLKRQQVFERVNDELSWILGSEVSPKYLGDDMVLLIGLSDTRAHELIKEEISHGTSAFYSMEKWNLEIKPGNKLVWMQCWGIPLVAWSIEHMRNIVATVGDLVEVDDFEEMQRLDRARVLVRTPWTPTIKHSVTVHIDGDIHKVHIVEENWSVDPSCARHRQSFWGSSEEILSDTRQSRLSVTLPRLTTAKGKDDLTPRWTVDIPNGRNVNDNPLGKDRGERARCPSTVLKQPGAKKGKETYLEECHPIIAAACYGEVESHPAGAVATVSPKRKATPSMELASVDDIQQLGTCILDQGQKGESCSKQNNGPLKHNFKHSRDTNVNLFGPNNTMDLISPTTPEDQQKGQQHDQKKKPTSAFQVYSRKKGYTKKWALLTRNESCIEECNAAHGQTWMASETETGITIPAAHTGGSIEQDSKDPDTQPQQGRTIQIEEEASTNLHADAIAQWEMAKQLGMSCRKDQTRIIDKIAEMEIRDKQEAEKMGNRSNIP